MAQIKPFAALRPEPTLAGQICELPYDVLSSAEARDQAKGNPLSFFHVSKPEIDLPEGTDPYSPEVYAKGAESLGRLMAQGALRQEPRLAFYLYRQVMGRHSQTGLVAAASCADYLRGHYQKARIHPPRQGGRPGAPYRGFEFADRPGLSDLSRGGGVWMTFVAERTAAGAGRRFYGQRRRAAYLLDGGRRRRIRFYRTDFCQHAGPLHCRRSSSQRGGRADF